MSTTDENVESREGNYRNRKIIGFVADNNPANGLKVGEVRVRVPDLHGDEATTPTADLPIAIVRLGSIIGSGPGFGMFGVLPLDTTVCVEYQGGNLNHPIVTGVVITGANVASLPAEYLSDYPNVYGWKDPDGNVFLVNMAQHTIKMTHKTGKFLKFEADGSLSTSVENLNAVVAGNTSIISDGNTTITSLSGDVTVDAQSAKVTVNAGADMDLTAGGTMKIDASLIEMTAALIKEN